MPSPRAASSPDSGLWVAILMVPLPWAPAASGSARVRTARTAITRTSFPRMDTLLSGREPSWDVGVHPIQWPSQRSNQRDPHHPSPPRARAFPDGAPEVPGIIGRPLRHCQAGAPRSRKARISAAPWGECSMMTPARGLVLASVALLVGLLAYRAAALYLAGSAGDVQVGFVYDSRALRGRGFLREAYQSVAQEEGIPHRWLSTADLLLLDGHETARRYPALVFPDGLVQQLPSGVLDRTREYMEAGGHIAVVFDAGVREPSGAYRSGGLLADLVGVQYLRYRELGD